MNSRQIDWSVPQRQSWAALFIILYKIVLRLLKIFWPFLLYYLFKNKSGKFDSFELMIVGLSSVSLLGSILEFIYFRFYIQENNLIIKSGFLSKKTISIPLDKIQAVHIEQTLLHNLLNAARLSFDSAGSEKIEVKIHAINTKEAEDFKRFILHARPHAGEEEQAIEHREQMIIDLGLKDLLKLSISANHLEAFLLLLAFFVSTLEQVKDIFNVEYSRFVNWVYQLDSSPFTALVAGAVAALLVSIIISTARVFIRYFDFRISKSDKGFLIHSGLINIQEKLVPFSKVQFISWKANWIRQRIGLYLLHFHAIGYGDMKEKLRIKVPITRTNMIPVLLQQYHPLLPIKDLAPLTIHRAFIARRILLAGLLPAAVLGLATFYFFGWSILWLLAWVGFIGIYSFFFQRKFRLWMGADALQIRRGFLGREELILKWNMVQSVILDQSIYQRSHDLANITLHTAGGNVKVPFIPLAAANHIVNYALYKVES